MTRGISAAVADFVKSHITSVEEMEVMALMHSRPGIPWTVEGLARELGSTTESITGRLVSFIALRIVAARAEGGRQVFACAPADPDVAALLREVVRTYRERRIAMTTLIYERPTTPLRSFADAFRLRKDGPT
jgi:hypothetical protein